MCQEENSGKKVIMTIDAWVDLHVHTNFSDGLLTPTQMVQRAKEIGLKALGIVDHDTIDGLTEAVEAGSRCDVEIVPGVELSSQYKGRDIHIIGYYFDPEHPRFVEYLELFRKERYRRATKMIQNLNRLGVHMTMDEVEVRVRGGSIGRPHLAEVLMEKGYVETFQEAFQRYIGYGSEAYEEKYKIHPEDAIALISEAKGLSFIAHPGLGITDEILVRFIKSGLDGIEVIHPKLSERRTQHLQEIARKYDVLISGGSDCHGGRNGFVEMGKYTVPYRILEKMKSILRARWDLESPLK
jgi:predicted metal-dependent phosphoesterase TrpH